MRPIRLLAAGWMVLFGVTQACIGQQCQAGSRPRLKAVNNCGEDVWMIETPPGSVSDVQAQWDWFKAYRDPNNPDSEITLPNGGVVIGVLLTHHATQDFCVPDKGAPGGNFRFYMGCPAGKPFDTAGCTIGSQTGDRSSINTLFEPTFGCMPPLSGTKECAFNPAGPASDCQHSPGPGTCPALSPGDNFDISAVDGYTIPMRVDAQPLPGETCNRRSTDAGMLDLASCPVENASTLFSDNATQSTLIKAGISMLTQDTDSLEACTAPFKWMQTNSLGTPTNPSSPPSSGECDVTKGTFNSSCFYSGGGCDTSNRTLRCPDGSGPQEKVGPLGNGTKAIQNTNWVQNLYALGYGGYTWQYGDGVGDQACGWGSTITVNLCPRGGTPYRKSQLWTFSEADGDCSTDGRTGTPDGVTTFKSLAACQNEKMRYVCDNLTDRDIYKLPTLLWKADVTATLNKTGLTYSQLEALKTLTCLSYTLDIPEQGTLTVPECNYLYDTTPAVCPAAATGAPRPAPITFPW